MKMAAVNARNKRRLDVLPVGDGAPVPVGGAVGRAGVPRGAGVADRRRDDVEDDPVAAPALRMAEGKLISSERMKAVQILHSPSSSLDIHSRPSESMDCNRRPHRARRSVHLRSRSSQKESEVNLYRKTDGNGTRREKIRPILLFHAPSMSDG